MTIETIFTEALALPAEQRVKLLEQLRSSLPTTTWPAVEVPTGVPIPGRCQGMMSVISDDDDHLHDFAEYMP
jgi:hypothetical protein